jgi:hypothetical protein
VNIIAKTICSKIIPLLGLAAAVALCSCATDRPQTAVVPAQERPPDVRLEKWAGRGSPLFTKIHTEDGREFRCVLDTGSPSSLVPASIEPMLGKCLGSGKFLALDSPRAEPTRIYAAPKLFLGNTLLVTGTRIGTVDEPVAVLGMDCLRHYCIQLDFKVGQLRFLDPQHLDTAGLGKAFPLVASPYAMIDHAGLFGEKTSHLIVDTGCGFDGYLEPALFTQKVRQKEGRLMAVKIIDDPPKGSKLDFAEFPECVWDGNTYTNLLVGKGPPNLIGMRFLARHLVTLNFPKGLMYLKMTAYGPLD